MKMRIVILTVALLALCFTLSGCGQAVNTTQQETGIEVSTIQSLVAVGSRTLGLRSDGTVVIAGGNNDYGENEVTDWKDIIAIDARWNWTVGVRSDGKVIAVGDTWDGEQDLSSWTDIVAVAVGSRHTVGLRADGTVVSVGLFDSHDVDDWTDIVSVAAGDGHIVGLRSDGTVVAVGNNEFGQCDVGDWTDIVEVSAGDDRTVGLRSDGTVVAVGSNNHGECELGDWTDIVAIDTGYLNTVGLKANGSVVIVGDNSLGQCDGVGKWKNIVAVSEGSYLTAGLRSDGTVVAVGDDGYGGCDVDDWTDIKRGLRDDIAIAQIALGSDESMMEEPVSEPEEYELDENDLEAQIDWESEDYMDLDGISILAMAPFVDDVGWIQYMRDGEMYTAAVEVDGRVLFEIPGPVWYASQFDMGVAYIVISDNATYYSNADQNVGCYEQVAPAITHEEIYDLDGNLWYTTAEADYGEEHILCSKDDKFVVLRHESGLDHDDWTLGTINRFGDTVDEFQSYDGVDGGVLPTWRSKYSGTRKLPNKYGAGYGNGNDGDPGDGFSRYIGDGAFYLTGGSFGKLYQPEKQTVVALKSATLLSDVFDRKVLSYWNGTYYIQGINSSDAYSVQALRDNQYVDIQHRGFSDGFRHMMADNLFYHDHAYYDMDMNRVVEISDYTNLEMDGSIFHEGYALIALKGMDGNRYVTVIDESGTVQFEPIQANRTSQRISNGFFVVRTDTECAVYDIYGNYVRYLCPVSEAEYIYDISGGYATVNGFGVTRIFALNPTE